MQKTPPVFEQELSLLPDELKQHLLQKSKKCWALIKAIHARCNKKSMGFYFTPAVKLDNNLPKPNFDRLTLHFLFDDCKQPLTYFDAKLLLGNDFESFLIEKKHTDKDGQEVFTLFLANDPNIQFLGSTIQLLRKSCFECSSNGLEKLSLSFIIEDNGGFIGALKTITIHKSMLLQKFEQYVTAYIGLDMCLKEEKSNDFDVLIVFDDFDIKKMPKAQVKDQLTEIIYQILNEITSTTKIKIQVHLLSNFCDVLKNAPPAMVRLLKNGAPLYGRKDYASWLALLKRNC